MAAHLLDDDAAQGEPQSVAFLLVCVLGGVGVKDVAYELRLNACARILDEELNPLPVFHHFITVLDDPLECMLQGVADEV